MDSRVSVQRTEGIAVLTVDHPPHNALDAPVRAALLDAVTTADDDGEIRAIVLAARGRSFAARPDLAEIDREPRAPDLGELCQKIEALATPVVAALHGSVLDGGLELALAAHYRIADRRAIFAMPAVALGLVPRAGGTQRLPRLVGPPKAAEILLSGRPVAAATAAEIELVDAVAEGPLPVYTLKYVLRRLQGSFRPRPTSAMRGKLAPAREHLAALAAMREKAPSTPTGTAGILFDCIEATLLLPFEAGLSFERAVADDQAQKPATRALRHLHRAEIRARTAPVSADAVPRKVTSVGVVGGGLMGTGIAAAALDAGFEVTLVEAEVERLEASVENVIDIFDRKVARGQLDTAGRDTRIARLRGQTDLAALGACDLVIEAATEEAEVKRRIFSGLDAVMKRGAILATATSGIDIDGMAAGISRPRDVIGLHFLPPAHVIRLCEIVVAVETSDEAIATAFDVVVRMRKVPVAAGVADGYIAQRVMAAYQVAAEEAVFAGAGIADVDAAMRGYGFGLGPFEMADLTGLDLSLARRAPFGLSQPSIAERLLSLGRPGRRTGRGFYRYDGKSRHGTIDEEVSALVSELRALRGGARGGPEGPGDEAIRRRCVAAMANAGAALVADGVARRPSDVDVAMVAGYGFPRHRGGPMMAADLTGLLRLKRDIDGFATSDAAFWTATPLIAELIREGQTFADLNDAPEDLDD